MGYQEESLSGDKIYSINLLAEYCNPLIDYTVKTANEEYKVFEQSIGLLCSSNFWLMLCFFNSIKTNILMVFAMI